MDLRQLRYFIAVAEERHFGRAAERLHMAQPPVSQQIRRLEAELGVKLLFRTTRRVELAPAGEVLLERARELLAGLDAAVDDTRRAARGEVGRLSIGFTGSATYALLPAVAEGVRTALPRVQLDLHGEMLTPAQVEGLVEGTLDLAVLRPPVHRRDLILDVVGREPLVAVIPQEHWLAREESIPVGALTNEPFVTYPSHFRSVIHDAVEEVCDAHGFLPRVELEVAETATLVSFVAAGIGVSLVPASVARMKVEGAVYRPLDVKGPGVTVELAIAWRRDNQDPVLERVLPIVRERIGARGDLRPKRSRR